MESLALSDPTGMLLSLVLDSSPLMVSEPQNTFLLRVFNWYFVAASILGELGKSAWMVFLLGFDPLFTILTGILWLIPPSFNLIFLLADDAFKLNIITNHMWFLWTLTLIQVLLVVIDWHLQQGEFTKYFKVPINISSVFIAGANIMNYLF